MRGEAVAAAVLALSAAASTPAAADAGDCWNVAWRCDTINAFRAEHGRPPLDQAGTLQAEARAYAHDLAADGVLRHADIDWGGEAIGRSTDWATVLQAWKDSSCVTGTWDVCPGHRELMLDRDFTRIGIGSALGVDGMRYYVLRFR